MDIDDSGLQPLKGNQTNSFGPVTVPNRDMPVDSFYSFMEITSYLMICVAVFGFAGNILNVITYTKIGFQDSINISYVALGVSDLLCIICLLWNAMVYVPALSDVPDIPFIPREFGIPTGGYTSAMFLKTTAWITAFISLERCLCVVFPLKIKSIVSRRRTIAVITVIFILTVVPTGSILFYIYEFKFRFDAARNITLLRVGFRKTPLSNALSTVDFIYKLVLMNFNPFIIILICAIILAIQLNRSATWRIETLSKVTVTHSESQDKDGKVQKKLSKDLRVAKTVLAIAIAFLFPGTISTIKYMLALTWPAFHPVRDYGYYYRFSSRMEFLLSLINSSVNFIIYYKMGTKFRATVKNILQRN